MLLLLQIDRDVKAICDTIRPPSDAPCVLISNYTLMQMEKTTFKVALKALITGTSEPEINCILNMATRAMALNFYAHKMDNFTKANAINWEPLGLSPKEQFSQQFTQQLC